MDRKQEYEALLQALEETPPALEYTVQRARARKKRRRAGRILGIPAASLAGVFTAFVVLVNTSMPFAMACGNIPGLRELTAAVALSPSLKEAVEHDYAQYIGQSQTNNGITLELAYLILDPAQMNFFLKVTGPEEYDMYEIRAKFEDADGGELTGYGSIMNSFGPGELTNAVSLHISDDSFRFPERMRMTCQVAGWDNTPEPGRAPEAEPGGEEYDPRDEWKPQATFTFELSLDTSRLNDCVSIPAGDWVEVDGQKLRFSLDSYITQGRLTVEEHPDNTASLKGLDFYLEDEKGRRYENTPSNGLSALGASYVCDTTYYDRPEHVTVCLRSVTWLEEGREFVTVDLEQGVALEELPRGVQLFTHRDGEDMEIALTAPYRPGKPNCCYQVASWDYRDPEGGEHRLSSSGTLTGGYLPWDAPEEKRRRVEGFTECLTLPDYPWDTVELGMSFSRHTTFEAPVRIHLT